MKLLDILKELEKPKKVYTDEPEAEKMDDDFLKKGFKLGKPIVDPETGSVGHEVTYLPNFEKIRRDVIHMRTEFQPYKFSGDKDIAKLAKDINTNLTKISQMIFALDKMVELYKKSK